MKKLIGKVVGGKMEKTVLVAVESTSSHPLYKKIIKKFKNIKVD
ncbi:MAG: 30S ribosomal protein S17, partial [Candidatus Woykebacteria bacterium RBG_13_40_7b]